MIFQTIGVAVVVAIVVFVLLWFLYWILRRNVVPVVAAAKMPVLRPVPIPTKNRRFLMRVLVWLFDVRKWKLVENWHFTLSNGIEIVLPKDFIFDGASIPRLFWFLLSPVGLLLIPALIHDYGYRYDQLWKKDENGQIVAFQKNAGRRYWDKLFRNVGEEVNGFAVIDSIAWLGVRLGGSCNWKKHRRTNAPPAKPH